MLELIEETLDLIALFVEFGVVFALDLAVALGRDDDFGTGLGNLLAKVIGVIALIGDGDFGFKAIDQIMGESDVIALTR